jgi:GT2 family glycosyltransferase
MTGGVVIVVWNGEEYIDRCLRSVLDQTVAARTIVVVDNASDDRSREIVSELAPRAAGRGVDLRVVEKTENTGFTAGANEGLRLLLAAPASHDVVVLLNQDAELDASWLASVSAAMNEDARVGAVGSRLLTADGSLLQHAGGYTDRPRRIGRHYGHREAASAGGHDQPREVEFVTAAAVALRAAALREVGLFDEVFSPGYYEDVDLCWRLREANWKVLYLPSALATHVESASFSRRPDRLSLSHRNRLIFALKWLTDDGAREEFSRAERDYFAGACPDDDRQALGQAYLEVLLVLPEAVQARFGGHPPSPRLFDALVELFAGLRRELLEGRAAAS